MKIPALIIFTATYVLLLIFPKIRAYIALGSAALFVILGIIPVDKLPAAVDWNVLMMIAGTMGIVSLFTKSKMPSLLADIIIDKMPDVKWAIISLAVFAGFISAFVDNVATVLMIAPVALTISKKLRVSPVPAIIAIAVSSNLQGAATLVGDTTSILLGSHANMSFTDFIFFKGKPGLFWVVEAGALVSVFILMFLFRKDKRLIHMEEKTAVTDYFPSFLLAGMVVLLIAASFIPGKPELMNGYICMGLFVIGLARTTLKTKCAKECRKALKEIDFFTILLLAGLFVVIGGISEAGIIKDISNIFISIGGDSIFLTYTLIVWASVLLSAVIDNIPYVATMLPVAAEISRTMGIEPYLFYFGLLIGATLGGNMTPIGASANIAGIGILRKEGHEVTARQFMRIGVPFTLAAVTSGYLLIWLIWR